MSQDKTESAGRRLPAEFADLEAFVDDWALPTEGQRYGKREQSRMNDIQRFYDAMIQRAQAALDFLDRIPLNEMPPEAKRLMYLLHSLATVSISVEVWKQPRVWDSGAAKLPSINEPLPV
jgi:hypothetical protein